MSIIQIQKPARTIRYNNDPVYRANILKQISERRQRQNNNGYTNLELKQITKFLHPSDNLLANIIYRNSHIIKRKYTRLNRHGIPTTAFEKYE